jgi:STE24 endopeptidase
MIAGFVLIAVIGYYFLDLAAKLLNLASLRTTVPEEFADFYDEQRYRRSQEYTRTNTFFEIACSSVTLVAFLVFWHLGGFNALDLWLRSFHLPAVATGVAYFAALCIAREFLLLPFELYDTFVIEQRFGFNRSTLGTFVADRIKQWFLFGILMSAFIALVLFLFEHFGSRAWLVAWGTTSLASVFLMYIAPSIVLPLFYRLKPVPSGELRERVTELCNHHRFPIRDLLVIDGSRRSSKANAFFIGFGRNKRIALYDTLINNHTIGELLAVLAHEVGHFKRRHVIKQFLFGQLNLFILFFAASFFLSFPGLFTAFGVSSPSYYVGLALFLLLVRPVGILFGVIGNFWSRGHEFEADQFAAEALHDATSLILALKKLSKDNLSNLSPHPLLVALHFTHPPVLARINALRRLGLTESRIQNFSS